MNFYYIIIIALLVVVVLAIGLFFKFILWMDKKIDKKDRLGSSVHNEKKK